MPQKRGGEKSCVEAWERLLRPKGCRLEISIDGWRRKLARFNLEERGNYAVFGNRDKTIFRRTTSARVY